MEERFRLRNTHSAAFQSGREVDAVPEDAVQPAGTCRSCLGFAELQELGVLRYSVYLICKCSKKGFQNAF